MLLKLYAALTEIATPLLSAHLRIRCKRGKEEATRLGERTGITGMPRPPGFLVWLHAASVGESQSALILIDALLKRDPAMHILVTTGTVTSAALMKQRLPPQALHQYAPLDHPQWVRRFMDHWRPNLALWMESELWPNTLLELQRRGIPAALVNARLSRRSFGRWRLAGSAARYVLGAFSPVLCQTARDAELFGRLGVKNATATGNLKFSAAPLPCSAEDLKTLQNAVQKRTIWLYASTHDGEEDLACRIHSRLKNRIPGLLTIIVPRHPERRDAIESLYKGYRMKTSLRSRKEIPSPDDDIYIADTLGELGLFYRLCPVACIGRSFSSDGGGGHNPIEAAQLGCAVLHGPDVQNLADIYRAMNEAGAATLLTDKHDFAATLETILTNATVLEDLREQGRAFALDGGKVLDRVMESLSSLLDIKNEKSRACL